MMATDKPRRLPSASQACSVIEDPRDVQDASVAGIADIRTGWFPHEDGAPLWFAEVRWRKSNLCVMGYGDTREEAYERALACVKARRS